MGSDVSNDICVFLSLSNQNHLGRAGNTSAQHVARIIPHYILAENREFFKLFDKYFIYFNFFGVLLFFVIVANVFKSYKRRGEKTAKTPLKVHKSGQIVKKQLHFLPNLLHFL
jgi:hypothetical protein